jgi:hypothetical protein
MAVDQPNFDAPDPFGEFPYTAQNPETGKEIQIADQDHLWQILAGFDGRNVYLLSTFLCHCSRLVDPESQEVLSRYYYSREFGVPPYPGGYDDQPAKWVEQCRIIKNAEMEAINYIRKKNGR